MTQLKSVNIPTVRELEVLMKKLPRKTVFFKLSFIHYLNFIIQLSPGYRLGIYVLN